MRKADIWSKDIVVQDCGGLLAENSDWEGDAGLLYMVNHVFDTNKALLNRTRPELRVDDIAFLVTAGTGRRAIAYARDGARAIIVEVGLIRALWTRAASIAHLPGVLANAFPIAEDIDQSWMAESCDSVPGMSDWDCSGDRAEYCVDLFLHMLEYVVVHEIAHHVRGHLKLVNAETGLHLIDETEARTSKTPEVSAAEGFLVQDLEFDADAYGLELSLAAMDEKHPFAMQWDQASATEWQFQLIFAQLMVAQVIDDARKADGAYSADGHPAPLHRAINYGNLVSRSLQDLVGGPLQAYVDMHAVAWSEAGYVAKGLSYPKGRWHDDHGKEMATGDYQLLEERYFASSRRIDGLSRG
ncbi:hypothetical protein EU803_15615 [Loktanella sp. IMCC34160]|uniref:hypothetical protein n=1 Tax=Loktanella sp. IMCC34160 TaxID=2510646 RepID=UPI00101D417D|nr:hypothetical protein [Loktanella sp. IMCC34160]RYG90041.1 hypothetical protein EU803_15615 [Loktanella sp. IMCC34160]